MFKQDVGKETKSVPKIRRDAVLASQSWCTYCGAEDARLWHVDHIIPRAEGGPNADWNLTKSCSACNSKKGSNMPELDFTYRWLRIRDFDKHPHKQIAKKIIKNAMFEFDRLSRLPRNPIFGIGQRVWPKGTGSDWPLLDGAEVENIQWSYKYSCNRYSFFSFSFSENRWRLVDFNESQLTDNDDGWAVSITRGELRRLQKSHSDNCFTVTNAVIKAINECFSEVEMPKEPNLLMDLFEGLERQRGRAV
jgi:hypothetical protein